MAKDRTRPARGVTLAQVRAAESKFFKANDSWRRATSKEDEKQWRGGNRAVSPSSASDRRIRSLFKKMDDARDDFVWKMRGYEMESGNKFQRTERNPRSTRSTAKPRYGVYVGDRLAYVSTKKLDSDKASRKLHASGAKAIKGKMVGPNPISGKIPAIGWRTQFAAVARQKLGPKRVTTPVGRTLRRTHEFGEQVTTAARRAVNPKYRFKIPGLGVTDKSFNAMPFGRQIDYNQQLADFKKGAKRTWLDTKRKSFASGLAEFKKLYRPTAWYAIDTSRPGYKDDSAEIWYTTEQKNPRRRNGADETTELELYITNGGQLYSSQLQPIQNYQGKWSGDGGKIKAEKSNPRRQSADDALKDIITDRSGETIGTVRGPFRSYSGKNFYTWQSAGVRRLSGESRTSNAAMTALKRAWNLDRKRNAASTKRKYAVPSYSELGKYTHHPTLAEARRQARSVSPLFGKTVNIFLSEGGTPVASVEPPPKAKRNAPSMLLRRTENTRRGKYTAIDTRGRTTRYRTYREVIRAATKKSLQQGGEVEVWFDGRRLDRVNARPTRNPRTSLAPAKRRGPGKSTWLGGIPREGYIVEVGKSRAIAWVGRTQAEALKIENALLDAGKKAVTYKAKLPATVKDGLRKAYARVIRKSA